VYENVGRAHDTPTASSFHSFDFTCSFQRSLRFRSPSPFGGGPGGWGSYALRRRPLPNTLRSGRGASEPSLAGRGVTLALTFANRAQLVGSATKLPANGVMCS